MTTPPFPFQAWENVGSTDMNRRFALLEEGINLPLSVLKRLLAGQVDRNMLSPDILTLFGNVRMVDRFTVTLDGAGQTFPLSSTPVANSEFVFINGVLQVPGTGYNIVGDALTIIGYMKAGDIVTSNYAVTGTVTTATVENHYVMPPYHQFFQSIFFNNDIFVRAKDSSDSEKYKLVKASPYSFLPIATLDVGSGLPDHQALAVVSGYVWAIGSPASAISNRVIKVNPTTMGVDFDLEIVPSTDTAAIIAGLATDGAGFLYAYVKGGIIAPHVVAKINTVGVPVITGTIPSGLPSASIVGNVDMLINQAGNLFVLWDSVASGNGQVRKYDVGTGALIKTYNTGTWGTLIRPTRMAKVFDAVYVIDGSTWKLWKIPATGDPINIITFTSQPTNIQFDGSDLWIAFGQDLVKMKPDAQTLSTFSPLVSGLTIQDLSLGVGHIWATYTNDVVGVSNITKIFPGLPGN
jgi:hypothetical protein